jgi:hypothetical protein
MSPKRCLLPLREIQRNQFPEFKALLIWNRMWKDLIQRKEAFSMKLLILNQVGTIGRC